MIGPLTRIHLCDFILPLRDLIFWLRVPYPPCLPWFKSRRPRQKSPINPLAPHRPSENHQKIGIFGFCRNVGHRPLVTLGWLRCLKSLPIGAIGCLEVPGVDPGWMWDSPEITQNCHQPKRPKTQLLLFPEIMIGPLTRIHLCDFIFGLYELKFLLNHPSPYNIPWFKFQNAWEKLTFDHRNTEQPTANFYFSLK